MDFLHSAIGQRRVKRIACRGFLFIEEAAGKLPTGSAETLSFAAHHHQNQDIQKMTTSTTNNSNALADMLAAQARMLSGIGLDPMPQLSTALS